MTAGRKPMRPRIGTISARRASPGIVWIALATLTALEIVLGLKTAQRIEPDALQLDKPVSVDKLPGFFAGLVSVQDAGAQYAAHLLDVYDGMRVLDACAAPGGKTAHILERAVAEMVALASATSNWA